MRKNIDIDPDTFRALSIQAAQAGKDLKNFIQDHLVKIAKKKVKD